MAFVLIYNSILQVLAAFVIFLFGYLVFFVFLIICLLIATGLYESAKWIRAYPVRSVSANSSMSPDFETPAHRGKRSVIPAWSQRLVERLAAGR
jgi:hypothetical protein